MKIIELEDGLDHETAEHIWHTIETNASYQFNKSHSVSYALVSYLTCYAKVHYAPEFFASTLSIANEDELKAIIKDAYNHDILVLPPHINMSGYSFEIGYDKKRDKTVLYAPFSAVTGISTKGAEAIIEARENSISGIFTSIEEFKELVNKRACNSTALENMNKVGAFASLDPSQPDPLDLSRLKDQKTLLRNIMINNVKASRRMMIDDYTKDELLKINDRIRAKEEDEHGDPTGIRSVIPTMGNRPKFMVITDYASYSELESGCMAKGKSFKYITAALHAAGLKKSDGYYTALIKTNKKDKQISNAEISLWSKILDDEIALMNPAIIICCGSASARYIVDGIKGGWEELSGQVIYQDKHDRSVFLAPNPQMIYVRPEVQKNLDDVFIEVSDCVS